MASPWSHEELNMVRTRLVMAALEVHKAFINQTKKKIRNNLRLLMDYFVGKVPFGTIQPYLETLWGTFHLIVPIVSTTFASFATMYRGMGRESIGWLFIDEAGQAVPQAALGAIWRSKRVVVVGDPLQIEPVVTIHDRIIEVFKNKYQLNEFVANKSCSVQTIADVANKYGTYLGEDDYKSWVGSPLFVHRRCIDPMFSISNRVAYDDLMVMGTMEPPSSTIYAFDKSFWLDIKGKIAGRHWVPEQGIEIVKIVIRAFKRSNRELPSLYIISPFTEVTYKLADLLKQSYSKIDKLVSKEEYHSWIRNSVGTVHTFQGKQADNVIFCLGLDITSNGSADWASKKPNLLNVAASRAKYRFCIVGDIDIWGEKPHFKVARQVLPVLNKSKNGEYTFIDR